jgi:hypothetical protein
MYHQTQLGIEFLKKTLKLLYITNLRDCFTLQVLVDVMCYKLSEHYYLAHLIGMSLLNDFDV